MEGEFAVGMSQRVDKEYCSGPQPCRIKGQRENIRIMVFLFVS